MAKTTKDDEIKELKDKLVVFEETQQQILSSVTELKLGVCGSKKIGVEGIVQRVKRNEIYIENDKKMKYKIAGGIIVIAFLFNLGLALLLGLFKKS